MATPYKKVVESFLEKIDDYKMLNYSSQDILLNSTAYMNAVCSDFNRICLIDLEDKDDYICEFANDLSREVIEIIAKGMVVEWLKPLVYKADAMLNLMNLKDATFYSPSTLLAQKRAMLAEAEKAYSNAVKNYSYYHAKLGELSI